MNARSLRKKLARQCRRGPISRAYFCIHVPSSGFSIPSPDWDPPQKWNGRGGLIDGRWHDVVIVGGDHLEDGWRELSRRGQVVDAIGVLVDAPTPHWGGEEVLDRFYAPFAWSCAGLERLHPELRVGEELWAAKFMELGWAPQGGGVILVCASPIYLDQLVTGVRRLFKAAARLGIRLRLEV